LRARQRGLACGGSAIGHLNHDLSATHFVLRKPHVSS
jgi:hypothetical protein